VTASALRDRSRGTPTGAASPAEGEPGRSLVAAGVIAAVLAVGSGLAVIIMLVLAAWIAAPHAGLGLLAVLRAATTLWLVGQHVGFTLRGTGRIGMLPLGLLLLPGALLWRAGRWVVTAAHVRRLRGVGYAALALAVPYSLIATVLALVSRSAQVTASVPQAAVCCLLLGFVAGGLGAARGLAPWPQLIQLLSDRARSVVTAVTASVAVLVAAGALLAGAALAVHLHEASTLQGSLGGGWVGTALLLLLQVAYVPNVIAWAISFMLGPGFSVGVGTIVAPTGSALGQLPAFPLLAALPPGVHQTMPAWLAPVVMALPYLAGALGGWVMVRAAPAISIEAAPLWGMASGVLAGALLGLLATFSGGPLGDERLSAVGPSGWQVTAVAAMEIGIGAAITAGVVNYVVLRRASSGAVSGASLPVAAPRFASAEPDSGHVIYLNPWEGDEPVSPPLPPGPSALP